MILGWWPWSPNLRGGPPSAQAHDRDRRQADSVAHPQNLLAPWHQPSRRLLRLQGLSHQGKGYLIKEYIANYFLHMSDVTFDMTNNRMEVHQHHSEPWKVTLVDTGEKTMAGGRLKRVANLFDPC